MFAVELPGQYLIGQKAYTFLYTLIRLIYKHLVCPKTFPGFNLIAFSSTWVQFEHKAGPRLEFCHFYARWHSLNTFWLWAALHTTFSRFSSCLRVLTHAANRRLSSGFLTVLVNFGQFWVFLGKERGTIRCPAPQKKKETASALLPQGHPRSAIRMDTVSKRRALI